MLRFRHKNYMLMFDMSAATHTSIIFATTAGCHLIITLFDDIHLLAY